MDLESNSAENWKRFIQKWKNYATITQLSDQPTDYHVTLLHHTLGDRALIAHNGITFDTVSNARLGDEILAKFRQVRIRRNQ